MSQYPTISQEDLIDVHDPDNEHAMPLASGTLPQISRMLVSGRYLGQAWTPTEEDPVPVHVRVTESGAAASHVDDPHGIANPERQLARRQEALGDDDLGPDLDAEAEFTS